MKNAKCSMGEPLDYDATGRYLKRRMVEALDELGEAIYQTRRGKLIALFDMAALRVRNAIQYDTGKRKAAEHDTSAVANDYGAQLRTLYPKAAREEIRRAKRVQIGKGNHRPGKTWRGKALAEYRPKYERLIRAKGTARQAALALSKFTGGTWKPRQIQAAFRK